MISLIATYKVRAGQLEKVKETVRGFVQNIRDNEPGTLQYDAFQEEDDEMEFVHLVVFKDAAAEKAHEDSDYVKRFVDVLYPLCEKPPEFTRLSLVESKTS